MLKLQLGIGIGVLVWAGGAGAQCPCAEGDGACLQVGAAFPRITDALAQARLQGGGSASARLTICVPPGEYTGSFTIDDGTFENLPIVIDVPYVTLQGKGLGDATVPTEADMADAPVIDSDVFLDNTQTLVVFARTGHLDAAGGFVEDSAGDHSRLTGFVLRQPSTDGFSQAVWADRVDDFRIDHNWSTSNGCVSIVSQAASGRMDHNLASDNGCGGFGTGAGSHAHPATVSIDHNVATRNGILGAIPGGAAFALLPPLGAGNTMTIEPWDTTDVPDVMNVTITNNSFINNGVTAIRLFGYPPTTIPGQTTSNTVAVVEDNDLSGNGVYGLVVDGGFAHKKDPRTFSYNIDLTLRGNSWGGNGLARAMFGFATIWAMLKPDCGSSSAYKQLRFSRFTVRSDDDLGDFDYVAVGDDNVLTVNQTIVRGSQLPQLLPDLSGFCH
jgi:hypothetical protein